MIKALRSDWQFSGIWTMDTGFPFSVTSPIGNSLSATGMDFADLVPGVSPVLGDRSRGESIAKYFETAAFTHNATGTFGTTGRNILRAPGISNLDLSVSKAIRLTERFHTDFRVEFFNLANTP